MSGTLAALVDNTRAAIKGWDSQWCWQSAPAYCACLEDWQGFSIALHCLCRHQRFEVMFELLRVQETLLLDKPLKVVGAASTTLSGQPKLGVLLFTRRSVLVLCAAARQA